MAEKIMLEFFPEIIVEIPESPGGSCCLKPVVTQSKNSTKMYILAQHLQWMFKKRIELIIPSKTESKILPKKKYIQFKADLLKKRYGISKLPALVLAGKVICEGNPPDEDELESKVKKILNEIKK